jgi:hypothetical protein
VDLPPQAAPAFVRSDGSYVVASQIPTPDRIGYPVHVLDPMGRFSLSFGADTPQFRPDLIPLTVRLTAPARDGSIWTVAPGRYVLEKWDPESGTRVARIGVRSSWFSDAMSWPADETVRPSPLIEALSEDSNGLVWVLTRVAASDWKPPARANEERPLLIEEWQQTHDWILEAIDPVTGMVAASRRFTQATWLSFDGPVLAFLGDRAENNTIAWEIFFPVVNSKEARQ